MATPSNQHPPDYPGDPSDMGFLYLILPNWYGILSYDNNKRRCTTAATTETANALYMWQHFRIVNWYRSKNIPRAMLHSPKESLNAHQWEDLKDSIWPRLDDRFPDDPDDEKSMSTKIGHWVEKYAEMFEKTYPNSADYPSLKYPDPKHVTAEFVAAVRAHADKGQQNLVDGDLITPILKDKSSPEPEEEQRLVESQSHREVSLPSEDCSKSQDTGRSKSAMSAPPPAKPFQSYVEEDRIVTPNSEAPGSGNSMPELYHRFNFGKNRSRTTISQRLTQDFYTHQPQQHGLSGASPLLYPSPFEPRPIAKPGGISSAKVPTPSLPPEDNGDTLASPVSGVHDYFTATDDYTVETEDELKLKKGEEVIVMRKEDEGWWYAQRPDGSAGGWVPASHLVATLSIKSSSPSHQLQVMPQLSHIDHPRRTSTAQIGHGLAYTRPPSSYPSTFTGGTSQTSGIAASIPRPFAGAYPSISPSKNRISQATWTQASLSVSAEGQPRPGSQPPTPPQQQQQKPSTSSKSTSPGFDVDKAVETYKQMQRLGLGDTVKRHHFK